MSARLVWGGVAAAVVLPLVVLAFGTPIWLGLLAAGATLAAATWTAPRSGEQPRAGEGAIAREPALRAALQEALPSLERLEAAAAALPTDDVLRERARHIGEIAARIIQQVHREPERVAAAQRLLTYYLPRTAELMEAAAILARQRAVGPAGAESRRRLAELGEIAAALAEVFERVDIAFAEQRLPDLDLELRLIRDALREDLQTRDPPPR